MNKFIIITIFAAFHSLIVFFFAGMFHETVFEKFEGVTGTVASWFTYAPTFWSEEKYYTWAFKCEKCETIFEVNSKFCNSCANKNTLEAKQGRYIYGRSTFDGQHYKVAFMHLDGTIWRFEDFPNDNEWFYEQVQKLINEELERTGRNKRKVI
jgi:hypothetical protein